VKHSGTVLEGFVDKAHTLDGSQQLILKLGATLVIQKQGCSRCGNRLVALA
jgi:hypothetical protein